MSFPLDIAAFGCTALLPTVATPYGCFFSSMARYEPLPVRVLTGSVSDVGRSPVTALSHRAAAGATDMARSGPPTPRPRRVRLWIILWLQHCIDRLMQLQHRPVSSSCRAGPAVFHCCASTCRTASKAGTLTLPCRCPFRPGLLPPWLLPLTSACASLRGTPPGHCLVDASEEENSPGCDQSALDPTQCHFLQRRRVVMGFCQEDVPGAGSLHRFQA